MKPIIEIQDLVKYYGKGEHLTKAVDHVSLTIERGKFTAVVGRSGSGKSTLLHLIGGLDKPDKGKVWVDGKDIFSLSEDALAKFRRRKIGFVFQDYNLLPSLNVWENVVLPLGLDARKIKKEEIEGLIEAVGLMDKRKSRADQLSGGQMQRAAIARALAAKPAVILADEPTGNLDSHSELEVLALLKQCVAKFGQTLVMITHDETVAQMADTVIEIGDGKVVHTL